MTKAASSAAAAAAADSGNPDARDTFATVYIARQPPAPAGAPAGTKPPLRVAGKKVSTETVAASLEPAWRKTCVFPLPLVGRGSSEDASPAALWADWVLRVDVADADRFARDTAMGCASLPLAGLPVATAEGAAAVWVNLVPGAPGDRVRGQVQLRGATLIPPDPELQAAALAEAAAAAASPRKAAPAGVDEAPDAKRGHAGRGRSGASPSPPRASAAGAGADDASRSFLKRKSTAPRPQKLDWGHVRPKTVSHLDYADHRPAMWGKGGGGGAAAHKGAPAHPPPAKPDYSHVKARVGSQPAAGPPAARKSTAASGGGGDGGGYGGRRSDATAAPGLDEDGGGGLRGPPASGRPRGAIDPAAATAYDFGAPDGGGPEGGYFSSRLPVPSAAAAAAAAGAAKGAAARAKHPTTPRQSSSGGGGGGFDDGGGASAAQQQQQQPVRWEKGLRGDAAAGPASAHAAAGRRRGASGGGVGEVDPGGAVEYAAEDWQRRADPTLWIAHQQQHQQAQAQPQQQQQVDPQRLLRARQQQQQQQHSRQQQQQQPEPPMERPMRHSVDALRTGAGGWLPEGFVVNAVEPLLAAGMDDASSLPSFTPPPPPMRPPLAHATASWRLAAAAAASSAPDDAGVGVGADHVEGPFYGRGSSLPPPRGGMPRDAYQQQLGPALPQGDGGGGAGGGPAMSSRGPPPPGNALRAIMDALPQAEQRQQQQQQQYRAPVYAPAPPPSRGLQGASELDVTAAADVLAAAAGERQSAAGIAAAAALRNVAGVLARLGVPPATGAPPQQHSRPTLPPVSDASIGSGDGGGGGPDSRGGARGGGGGGGPLPSSGFMSPGAYFSAFPIPAPNVPLAAPLTTRGGGAAAAQRQWPGEAEEAQLLTEAAERRALAQQSASTAPPRPVGRQRDGYSGGARAQPPPPAAAAAPGPGQPRFSEASSTAASAATWGDVDEYFRQVADVTRAPAGAVSVDATHAYAAGGQQQQQRGWQQRGPPVGAAEPADAEAISRFF